MSPGHFREIGARIVSIVGARPNFVKLARVVHYVKEINRRVTDHISTLLFASTYTAVNNPLEKLVEIIIN